MEKKAVGYVFVQFALFGMYVFPIRGGMFTYFSVWRYLFLIFVALGFLMIIGAMLQLRNQLTPFPVPTEKGQLMDTGFFRFTRHPIYAGILWVCFFYGCYTGSFWKLGVSLLLYILFYFKSSYEEKLLQDKYPEYERYRKQVGRFWPKI